MNGEPVGEEQVERAPGERAPVEPVNDGQFEHDFRAIFEDVFGWGVELGDADGPATVEEWDSLAQIRLVHELESRFGVRLPDTALLEEQSVGSLRALVLAHAG